MKRYQLTVKRIGEQNSKPIYPGQFDKKIDAVKELHRIGATLANESDAIYTKPDDETSNVLFTANGMVNYSDILKRPTENDDELIMDVYIYAVEEINSD
jgi:hypothetical protein